MTKTWRAAAIGHTGQGNFGHGLHLAYKGLPNVEMVAIADPDEDGRQSAMAATGGAVGYADWREMLEKEKPDVVSVCPRWLTHHCEMVVGCAEAGCHVYCEKAIARNLEEADRMVEACDAAGVRLAVSHQSRYVEPYRTLRDMVRRGDIGRPLAVHARGKEDHRGGGEDMMVLGTHVLDLMRFLVGDPEWAFGHVTQEGRSMVKDDAREATEPIGLIAGNGVVAMYGFPDGLRGYFESRQGMSKRGPRMGLTIVGQDATLAIRYGAGRELVRSAAPWPPEQGGEWEIIDVGREPDVPGAQALERDDFIARGNRQAVWDLMHAAEERRDPVSSGRDARWALEMILGVYASHLEGRALPMPLEDRRHPLA